MIKKISLSAIVLLLLTGCQLAQAIPESTVDKPLGFVVFIGDGLTQPELINQDPNKPIAFDPENSDLNFVFSETIDNTSRTIYHGDFIEGHTHVNINDNLYEEKIYQKLPVARSDTMESIVFYIGLIYRLPDGSYEIRRESTGMGLSRNLSKNSLTSTIEKRNYTSDLDGILHDEILEYKIEFAVVDPEVAVTAIAYDKNHVVISKTDVIEMMEYTASEDTAYVVVETELIDGVKEYTAYHRNSGTMSHSVMKSVDTLLGVKSHSLSFIWP